MSVFPANATLIFQVPTGQVTIDPLGNPRVVTEEVTVSAYLRSNPSQRRSSDSTDGGELNRISLTGRIVGRVLPNGSTVPYSLPKTVLAGARAEATIDGHKGEFFCELSLQSVWGVQAVLGDKIEGLFVSEVAWGSAI